MVEPASASQSEILPAPEQGQLVQIRNRLFLVQDVFPHESGITRLDLECLDDDRLGESLSVLLEREVHPRVVQAALRRPQDRRPLRAGRAGRAAGQRAPGRVHPSPGRARDEQPGAAGRPLRSKPAQEALPLEPPGLRPLARNPPGARQPPRTRSRAYRAK